MALNNKQQLLIQELEEFYTQLRILRDLYVERMQAKIVLGSEERRRESIREELVRKSGRLKRIVVHLTGKQYGQQFNQSFDVWTEALGASSHSTRQRWSLGALMDNVNEAIGRLEAEPKLEKLFKITPSFESPKAFVAHGGESEALRKLRELLSGLNITPLVAEDAASQGRSINEQVEWCLSNSACAIILGTADDRELKDGRLYPRRNVYIEIGRVQERFPDKTIYLLEEGASFPSNISGKVYERFTQKNMEKAFIKVAKELSAFGILKAEKAEN